MGNMLALLRGRFGADNVWQADEVESYFQLGKVVAFGLIEAKRLSDGVEGTLQYLINPKIYYDFTF
jgi:hypothetical protein